MVHFDLDNFSRQAIGFDNLFNFASNISNLDTKYPPHDIIRKDEETYVIEFALAGFHRNNLKVEVKENNLTIEGIEKQTDGPEPEYLHKGIAKRSFEKLFVLADTLHVDNVTFKEGILRISIKQIIPDEQKPKTIKIN
jgi:molecular chaperone IbpA|tara:strand:- start:90 stop:503 length:414 start_codon:yes stop_codon:yes gene_type:complete